MVKLFCTTFILFRFHFFHLSVYHFVLNKCVNKTQSRHTRVQLKLCATPSPSFPMDVIHFAYNGLPWGLVPHDLHFRVLVELLRLTVFKWPKCRPKISDFGIPETPPPNSNSYSRICSAPPTSRRCIT